MERFNCDNDNCTASFPTQRGLSLHARSCSHALATATAAHAKRKADIETFIQRKKARLTQNEERLREEGSVSVVPLNHKSFLSMGLLVTRGRLGTRSRKSGLRCLAPGTTHQGPSGIQRFRSFKSQASESSKPALTYGVKGRLST